MSPFSYHVPAFLCLFIQFLHVGFPCLRFFLLFWNYNPISLFPMYYIVSSFLCSSITYIIRFTWRCFTINYRSLIVLLSLLFFAFCTYPPTGPSPPAAFSFIPLCFLHAAQLTVWCSLVFSFFPHSFPMRLRKKKIKEGRSWQLQGQRSDDRKWPTHSRWKRKGKQRRKESKSKKTVCKTEATPQ